MTDKKVIIFGIDGCPEEFLRKWVIEEDRLPNFRRVYDNGAFMSMNSTIPYMTVPAWLSMLTGKNPARLNTFAFYQRARDSYKKEMIDLAWERHNPLWQILSAAGHRSIIINVPSTLPPAKDFNGMLISGPIMNPDPQRIAYPDDLNRSLLKQGYAVDDYSSLATEPLKNVRKMFDYARRRIAIASALFREQPWDLFMFAFYFIDPIMHRFWKYMDAEHPAYEERAEYSSVIFDFFRLMDEHLGFYLDNLPPEGNLFIVSDHGMGAHRYFVDLNNWLQAQGYMRLAHDATQKLNLYTFQTTKAYDVLRRTYLRFRNIRAAKKLRDMFFNTMPKWERTSGDVDWKNTRAYSLGKDSIYVNLKGREPEGAVSWGREYDDLLAGITRKLHELKDPDTGEPVVARILRGRELYGNVGNPALPDIFVEFKNDSWYVSNQGEAAPGSRLFYAKKGMFAQHKRNTIFAGYGRDIKKTDDTARRDIYDIAPTVLHAMNMPVPDDVDGRVMVDIFRDDSACRKRDIRYSRSKPAKERETGAGSEKDAVILERLKNLGYL